MSVKKDIFTATGDYLMSRLQNYDAVLFPNGIIPSDLSLPGLKWFDKQMGQFLNPETSYALPLPCILMEYQQFTWEKVGKQQKRGNGIIRFTIYYENYADAFTGSVNQQLALNFFEFTEQVNIALEGFTIPGKMAPLTLLTDNEDTSEDMVITSTVDYGTIITDISAREDRKFVMVEPTVVVEKVDKTSRPVRQAFNDGFVI